LPFGAGNQRGDCSAHLRRLENEDVRAAYAVSRTLEVHAFTDLHVYLSANPHHAPTVAALGSDCPKRLGCLYHFLFGPQPVVQRALDEMLNAPDARGHVEGHVGVQVRNRQWLREALSAHRDGSINTPERVLACMARWVPDGGHVFFTSDETSLLPAARKQWGDRLREVQGGVFEPWSSGTAVNPSGLGPDDELAVIKTFVDWFALESSTSIVYTYASSFGKTAAEASDAVAIDVNHTRCIADERLGRNRTNTVLGSRVSVGYGDDVVPKR